MIVKIYVECMFDYNYLVHIKNSLDLYNSLVINNLLEESEHNIIMCAYWYKELCIDYRITSCRNDVSFSIGKYYSESMENLYK